MKFALKVTSIALGFGALALLANLPLSPARTDLSIFLPHAGGCEWYRTSLPEAREEPIVRFHVDCHDIAMSWNHSFRHALVWAGSDMDMMIWLVDVTNKESKRLGKLDGQAAKFYFTPANVPAAKVEVQTENGNTKTQIYHFQKNKWNRTKTTALPPYQRSDQQWSLVSNVDDQLRTLTIEPYAKAGRQWHQLKNEGFERTLLAYADPQEMPHHVPPLLRWSTDGKRTELEGLPYSDLDAIKLASQGRYLLITEAENGRNPTVYDWKTGKRVFHSQPAHLASFWPKPPTP